MKRIFLLVAWIAILASCNSGNEGSDSIYADSVRIKDSTFLADSIDNASTRQAIDSLQPSIADTASR